MFRGIESKLDYPITTIYSELCYLLSQFIVSPVIKKHPLMDVPL